MNDMTVSPRIGRGCKCLGIHGKSLGIYGNPWAILDILSYPKYAYKPLKLAKLPPEDPWIKDLYRDVKIPHDPRRSLDIPENPQKQQAPKDPHLNLNITKDP